MTVRMMGLCALVSTLPTLGCGTVANLTSQHPGRSGMTPFGGVLQNVDCIQNGAGGRPCDEQQTDKQYSRYPHAMLTLLCVADLPFSLLGDILTWPYTVAYAYINQPIPLPPQHISPSYITHPTLQPLPIPKPVDSPSPPKPTTPDKLPEPEKD